MRLKPIRGARAVGTRRRGKVLEAAIFKVVLPRTCKNGVRQLLDRAVAAKAGTSKPVIYRRSPTRAQLVSAALRANQPALSEAPDTGPSGAISWSFCAAFHKQRTNCVPKYFLA